MNKPPHFKGYRPIGLPEESNPIVFNFEEYEAIRLSDYELYGQHEAAKSMEVSRPTFARIYESARRKIALAFMQGRTIVFEGGKVYFDSEWYICHTCSCWFNHLEKDSVPETCALCGSATIEQFSEEASGHAHIDICVCPQCGFEKINTPENPCSHEICCSCNIPMVRKGGPHLFINKK